MNHCGRTVLCMVDIRTGIVLSARDGVILVLLLKNKYKLIRQMQEAESVTEELKENNQWLWIQSMNSIHNHAEEIVLKEIVYR